MARPTFSIVPARLKSLRAEAGMTQLELARRLQSRLGKSSATADATLVSDYQRIERTGRTSKKTATALAQILETSVETLQGDRPIEEPMEFFQLVERQLRGQLEAGCNEELKRRFETVRADGDDLADLARRIAADIEVAQLGSAQRQLAELSALTGWTVEQLQKQAYVHGYWFIQSTGLGANESKVVLGSHDVHEHVSRVIDTWPRKEDGGCSIQLEREGPWYHVEFRHPISPLLTHRFSFVRCQPDAAGLKWCNPTWTDQYWMEEPLQNWAMSTVNKVTGFDGQTVPADVRNLRLVVFASDSRLKGQVRRAVVRRLLDQDYEFILQRQEAERQEHAFMLNWLMNDCWDGLAPHLQASPPKDWTVMPWGSAVRLALSMNVPYVRWQQRMDHSGFLPDAFIIHLVEECADGSIRQAPWSKRSVETFVSALKERISSGYSHLEKERGLVLEEVPQAENTEV